MSSALNELQFELLPSEDAAAGATFGIGLDVGVDNGGFAPGDDDWDTQDEKNPRRGGTNFGRETLNGPTWGFNLHVDQHDVASAVDTLGRFKTAWRALHIRDTPGAVIPLRYRINDRVRRVYGRPRRFAAPPDNLILQGYVPITADFQCESGFTYSDEEKSITVGMNSPASDGGFVFPLTFPVNTLPVGTASRQAVVGGDAPAWPIIRFNGPVVNPEISTDDWTLPLTATISAGHFIEVDTRPWKMTVMLDGVSPISEALNRRTYLSKLALQPGRPTFVYRGASGGGSSSCEVRWSDTWNSI